MRYKTSTLCEIAILVAMISILGSIKIPNIIPGIEFQLSAPLAVAICSVFGFKKYIISGILSSVICLGFRYTKYIKCSYCHAISSDRWSTFIFSSKSSLYDNFRWPYRFTHR